MAGLSDSKRPINPARFRNVILAEARKSILLAFSVGSDIIMHIESILKPRKVITCVGISNDFWRFIVKPRE